MTFEEYRSAVLESLGASEYTNVRYFENYRRAALTALGVEFTDDDLRNEEKFRLKILDSLGVSDETNVRYFEDYRRAVLESLNVEYDHEDLRNEDRFRLKVFEGLEDIGPSADYQKLAGLEFDGKCYFETDIYLKGSDTVRLSLSVTGQCNVFGCYTGTSTQDNYSLFTGVPTGKFLRYDGGTYNSYLKPNTRYDVEVTPTGTNGMETDSTWTEKTFESKAKMCIGTTSPSASTAKLSGIVYGSIVINGRAELKPVKRKSDGVCGYYDTYTDTFYEPIGSNPVPI